MMDSRVKQELKDAETIQDIINVFDKYYNFKNYKLSFLYKHILIQYAERIINALNIPKK
jgi:hypothetical protein